MGEWMVGEWINGEMNECGNEWIEEWKDYDFVVKVIEICHDFSSVIPTSLEKSKRYN